MAPGFPNTPGGRLTAMSFAASGSPGFSSENDVVRSGCPPACVVEVDNSNDVMGWSAWAPAVAVNDATMATRAASVIRKLMLIFSLAVVRSAIAAPLVVPLGVSFLRLLDALALPLDLALGAALVLPVV